MHPLPSPHFTKGLVTGVLTNY